MKIYGLKITLSDKDNSTPEAFDKVLQKFKKLIRKEGIIKEIRDRMAFMKPSAKRRKKELENKRKGKK